MFNVKQLSANVSQCRYVIHQGGTGSGKTFAILQFLLYHAAYNDGKIISVVGESLPHLKRGALRDFKRIISMNGMDAMLKENKSNYTFKTGNSLIEFFSADTEAKLRGARRDILFINECNNIDYESFQQLDVRTRQQTILDFNPVRRFWVHNDLLPSLQPNDFLFLRTTYLDNDHLTPQEKANIERRRHNLNWWKVYGEGEIGMAEGVVFSNWAIAAADTLTPALPPGGEGVKSLPLGGDIEGYPKGNAQVIYPTNAVYGIDFGFTHSPTAIVQVWEQNGELYVHELLYRTGINNDELFAFAQKHIDLKALAVADSAEPKTIDYLFRKGWAGLKPASKGSDSVEFGINLLLDRKINVTVESLNLIKELRQYMWDTNKDGHFIHRPVKDFDHAIDALRYVVSYPKKKQLLFA